MIILKFFALGCFFAVVALIGGLMSLADLFDRHRRMNAKPQALQYAK